MRATRHRYSAFGSELRANVAECGKRFSFGTKPTCWVHYRRNSYERRRRSAPDSFPADRRRSDARYRRNVFPRFALGDWQRHGPHDPPRQAANGFQPNLALTYSTGNGNSLFGLGWKLSVPGITRKTAKGIPRYRDQAAALGDRDTFILSGAEDLVFVRRGKDEADVTVDQYRPRTEGLFAEIFLIPQQPAQSSDYWRTRTKDGARELLRNQSHTFCAPAVLPPRR